MSKHLAIYVEKKTLYIWLSQDTSLQKVSRHLSAKHLKSSNSVIEDFDS